MDAYGFERPADFDYKSYDEFMSHYVHVLARRAGRWATLLDRSDQLTLSRQRNLVSFIGLLVSFLYCCYYLLFLVSNLVFGRPFVKRFAVCY